VHRVERRHSLAELAVELATEVGVDAVVPWLADRCQQRWDGERGVKSLARWRSTAREAAKQSRRAWFPEVHELARIADVAALPGTLVVLHETATEPLSGLPLDGDVVLVVGPEGGLTFEEVLRSSTAGAAAAAVVSATTGRW